MCEQSAEICTPDVSLIDTVMAGRFFLEAMQENGSDHLQLLLIWGDDLMVVCDHARKIPINPCADWLLIYKWLDNGIHTVSSVMSLYKRTFCRLIKRDKTEAMPNKTGHK